MKHGWKLDFTPEPFDMPELSSTDLRDAVLAQWAKQDRRFLGIFVGLVIVLVTLVCFIVINGAC